MKLLRIFLAPFLVCVIATVALAQSGGGYDLSWSRIAGGGGTSGGGTYTMKGAIGQHDVAGLAPQGNKFSAQGGFWVPPEAPATPGRSKTYLPLVVK